jgi:hypothetical protein
LNGGVYEEEGGGVTLEKRNQSMTAQTIATFQKLVSSRPERAAVITTVHTLRSRRTQTAAAISASQRLASDISSKTGSFRSR